ncbi:MAG: proline--tRNA ligase [Candidatus Odinarchaeota archaeon]
MNTQIEKPKMIPPKKDFAEWYNEVLRMADIVDTTYPVKGFQTWLSYGWKIRNSVFNIVRNLLTETGHEEYYFPLLIPDNLFSVEKEMARGFEGEVYWVTKGGINPLAVKLAIRPTSEIPIYLMFSKWIRSYTDLPLKVWQLVNTVRYETKATKPLIRVREITSFKEAHTAHSTSEDALKQIDEAVKIYKELFDRVGVPYIISRRPEYDKFPGAEYSIAFDTIFPDGRTLQIGTVHYHGQRFSRSFDIKFLDSKGVNQYAYTTCYGLSERVIASILAIHGDDHGLKLPPQIAPIDIVIIPITAGKETDNKVLEYASKIKDTVSRKFTVQIDSRDLRPGKKYYEWELKGVPLRIEIGVKEVENGTVTVFRRDNFKKINLKTDNLLEDIEKLMSELEDSMFAEADKAVKSRIYQADVFFSLDGEDAISMLVDEETGEFKGGIIEVPVCDNIKCELQISNYLTVLGEPLEPRSVKGKCICGRKAVKIIRVSKQY